jgi:hypothetical protein
MSWITFKENIVRLSENPNAIGDIDLVAKTYAEEYDACIKRGMDVISMASVKQGNVEMMKTLFKFALQQGQLATLSYDLVGAMGSGVIAYWSTAVLNEFPIPLFPAPGSVQNISVVSNKVLTPGIWKPAFLIPPTTIPQTLVDIFIFYAQSHLATVTGFIITNSLYPPFATPGPGILNWTGYFIDPSPITIKLKAIVDIDSDDWQKPPWLLNDDDILRPIQSEAPKKDFDLNTSDFDSGTSIGLEGPDYTQLYVARVPTSSSYNSNPNFPAGADYSGYTGGPLSASDTIKKIYIPTLDKVHSDKSKGVKMLMAAQTQLEGFYPANSKRGASLSFRTNNPGNVGTDGINVGKFPTLEDGISAQWRRVLGPIFSGKSAYYKPSYSLFKYLSVYAPVMAQKSDKTWYKTTNDPTSYTNFVINYFKGQGITITADTTLEQIQNIK